MKRPLVLLGLILALFASACGSSGPLSVDSVTLARDDGNGKSGTVVTKFAPADHVIHADITLNRIETGLKVKTTWIAVDAGGSTNRTIGSNEFSALAANIINAKVSLPNDWPTGKYRLEIYLDDKLTKTVDFTVE